MAEKKLHVVVGANIDEFATKMKQMERELKNVEKQFSGFAKIGERLASVGKTLTLGVTLPILAIGTAATKMAMDAIESENLFEVSMGNMAKAAREWSEELSDVLGLNEYEIRKNVGTFNVMLDSMGLGEQAAFDMAKGLSQLTYDMASFYNLRPDEIFQKLQSGISGEIEPLKRLGIVVSATATETYAYTHGIADQGAKLGETQKIMARYGLIMEATSKAQGDLARTIESPTNQLRIAKSAFQEAAVSLGNILLPTITLVIKAIADFAKQLVDLDPAALKAIVVIGGLAAAVGPLLFVVGKMVALVPQVVVGFKFIGSAMSSGGLAAIATAGQFAVLAAAVAYLVRNIAQIAAQWNIVGPSWEMEVNRMRQTWYRFTIWFNQSIMEFLVKNQWLGKIFPSLINKAALSSVQKTIDAVAELEALQQRGLEIAQKIVKNTIQLERTTTNVAQDITDAAKAFQYQTEITDENTLATDENTKSKKTLADVLEDMGEKLSAATQNELALGDAFDDIGTKASIVEAAIKELTSMGLAASNPVIRDLVTRWGEYGVAIANAAKETEKAAKTMKALWKDACTSIGKELEQLIGNLGMMWLTGTGDWRQIIITFLDAAMRTIITAAIAAAGIAELVSKALSQMWNPFGWIIIAGLLIAMAAIRNKLAADMAAQTPALAEGGIITGPTLALIGEKPGSRGEAVIPLERMREFSGAGGGEQTIIINLDGRTIARTTVKHMPAVLRLQGVSV